MALTIKELFYPETVATLFSPIKQKIRKDSWGMYRFFHLMNRAALAGLGALALYKLVGFSSGKLAAAAILGCITSTPAMIIGAGSFAFGKGFVNMISAVSARSFSGVSSALALLLAGYVILNKSERIIRQLEKTTELKNLGFAEEKIATQSYRMGEGTAKWFSGQ